MADLKSLMPHIKRAVVVNGIMILYFLSPSFLSFVAIIIAVMAVIFQNPCQSMKSLLNCSEECSTTKCINQSFQSFKKLSIIEQLMLLVVLKLAVDFSWLIPSWVLIILAAQVFAVWGLLSELGIVEMGKKYCQMAHKAIQKVVALVPRYQGK